MPTLIIYSNEENLNELILIRQIVYEIINNYQKKFKIYCFDNLFNSETKYFKYCVVENGESIEVGDFH